MRPYRLILPAETRTAAVFASPHSGRDYPADFLAASVLSPLALRSSEDAYVDRLIDNAPAEGAPLLLASLPRAYVDLNRSPEDLDPRLIEGVHAQGQGNARVAAGLGVIPRVVAGGREIRASRISLREARRRIEKVHRPYHDALAELLAGQRRRFGQAVLFDMHSMPSEALVAARLRQGRVPDIVLGDLYGASAAQEITAAVEQVFRAEGLVVRRNAPFAGAYVARRHGRPGQGQHVVQVEIARALYLDEARVAPSADFAAFRALMHRLVATLARLWAGKADLAAE